MANENNKSIWQQNSWPITILTSVLAMGGISGGISYDNNTHVARLDERMMAHLDTHPDTELTRRIDVIIHEMNSLEDRVRDLEIDVGRKRIGPQMPP